MVLLELSYDADADGLGLGSGLGSTTANNVPPPSVGPLQYLLPCCFVPSLRSFS